MNYQSITFSFDNQEIQEILESRFQEFKNLSLQEIKNLSRESNPNGFEGFGLIIDDEEFDIRINQDDYEEDIYILSIESFEYEGYGFSMMIEYN